MSHAAKIAALAHRALGFQFNDADADWDVFWKYRILSLGGSVHNRIDFDVM